MTASAKTLIEALDADLQHQTVVGDILAALAPLRDAHWFIESFCKDNTNDALSSLVNAVENYELACQEHPRAVNYLLQLRDAVTIAYNNIAKVDQGFNFEAHRHQTEAQEIYSRWLTHWWEPLSELRALVVELFGASPASLPCFKNLDNETLEALRDFSKKPKRPAPPELLICVIPPDPAAPAEPEREAATPALRDQALAISPTNATSAADVPFRTIRGPLWTTAFVLGFTMIVIGIGIFGLLRFIKEEGPSTLPRGKK